MKKINLIFIRSKISSDPRELEEQKEQYLNELKKEYEISSDGESSSRFISNIKSLII